MKHVIVLLSFVLLTGCVSQNPTEPAASTTVAPATNGANNYREGNTWLCRPGRQDYCAIDLTTTVVAADGTVARETWQANTNAPIDCFYVYPTVSNDLTPTAT